MQLPAVRQPLVQLAHRRGRQVDQQLRAVSLRVDVVPPAGAGEGTEDRCGAAATLVADKEAVLAPGSPRRPDPGEYVKKETGFGGRPAVSFPPRDRRAKAPLPGGPPTTPQPSSLSSGRRTPGSCSGRRFAFPRRPAIGVAPSRALARSLHRSPKFHTKGTVSRLKLGVFASYGAALHDPLVPRPGWPLPLLRLRPPRHARPLPGMR
jgi:hypothetical protein